MITPVTMITQEWAIYMPFLGQGVKTIAPVRRDVFTCRLAMPLSRQRHRIT
jgi:hypothetical protein